MLFRNFYRLLLWCRPLLPPDFASLSYRAPLFSASASCLGFSSQPVWFTRPYGVCFALVLFAWWGQSLRVSRILKFDCKYTRKWSTTFAYSRSTFCTMFYKSEDFKYISHGFVSVINASQLFSVWLRIYICV